MEDTTTLARETTHPYGWVIAAAGFLVTFTTIGSGRYLYPVILPTMKDDLGLSYGLSGALASAIMVGYLVSCLVSGVLAVRLGFRVIIVLSTLALGFAMAGQAITSWYPVALFLMLVIGLGAGGAYIPTTGLVAAWFPAGRRGVFMSIVTEGANLGILSTAIFGPMILLAHGGTGWRPAWVYFGLAAIGTGVAGLLAMRDRPPLSPGPPGQAAAGAGRASRNWSSVFRNRRMLGLTAAYFCHGFFSIYPVFLFAFITRGLGETTEYAGRLWSLAGVMSALTIVVWGYLSDRWGRKQALIPCAALLALGIILPVFRQDAVGLYLSAFLFGVAYVGPMTIITVAAGDLVGPAMAAAAMGLVTMGHGVGQMAGPAIGGQLIDITGSFYPGFVLATAAILAEIIIIVRLPMDRVGAAGLKEEKDVR